MATAREIYRATKKTPDQPWNTYVCRPVAAVVVAAVEGFRVTPNQITLAAMAVALVSAVLLVALPDYAGLVAAVVVFELSYVLDCADGMLARWRGVQSATGHLLDFLMDEIKAFCILAAVSARLYFARQEPGFLLLGLGGLTCLASGIALTTFLRRPEVAGHASSPAATSRPRSPLGRALSVVESVAKFLIHYPSYILFAALSGYIEAFFFPYIAVNALYAARALATVAFRFGRGREVRV